LLDELFLAACNPSLHLRVTHSGIVLALRVSAAIAPEKICMVGYTAGSAEGCVMSAGRGHSIPI